MNDGSLIYIIAGALCVTVLMMLVFGFMAGWGQRPI
jgi:hypothetical protein